MARICVEHLKSQGLNLEEIVDRLGYETPGLLLEALGDLEYGHFSYVNNGYRDPDDDTEARAVDYEAALVCFLESCRDYTWEWADEGRVWKCCREHAIEALVFIIDEMDFPGRYFAETFGYTYFYELVKAINSLPPLDESSPPLDKSSPPP
jgi:hypothetical protein